MGNETILFVGKLGYHNKNIIEPIIERLKSLGHTVTQTDGNMDFFDQEVSSFIEETKLAINKDCYHATIIVFSDFWNFLIPLYRFAYKGKGAKFVGFFHGSVNIEGDVCLEIPKAIEYESYLTSVYDAIVCPNDYARNMVRTSNCKVSMFPMVEQIKRERPTIKHRKRIVYAHRWNYDKGNDQFIEFVKHCRDLKKPYEFVVIGKNLPTKYCSLEIDSFGWISQQEIKEICRGGGYAWSSVRSETIGYTIVDLVSYGLTPLVNNHEAYFKWWKDYIYTDKNHAISMIDNEVNFSDQDWNNWREINANNTNKITERILDDIV